MSFKFTTTSSDKEIPTLLRITGTTLTAFAPMSPDPGKIGEYLIILTVGLTDYPNKSPLIYHFKYFV